MWQRIKTAIVLVIIVGLAMFASDLPYPFLALLLFGNAIAAYEWTKLLPNKGGLGAAMLFVPVSVFLSFVAIAMMLMLTVSWPVIGCWVVALVIWLIAVVWIRQFPEKINWYDNRLILIGWVILTAAMSAMFYLWSESPWWLLYVFVLVWCADSGAYFVGRKLGKRKMAPKVSPNKSMEGLYGGLATGLMVVLAVSYFKLDLEGTQLVAFIALSAVTIVASVFGDLFESMLKRQAGIKDSGSILPGHGGVLDRIDSLLSATPIFALGFWAIQQSFI